MPSNQPVAPAKRFNIELLLGLSATFLSFAALIVSIFQTRIARDQQQASVWPYVQLASNYIDNDFMLVLRNNGVGPALIKKVEFGYHGKNEPSHIKLMNEVLNTEMPRDSVRRAGRFFNDLRPGDVIKAGDEIEIYKTQKNNYVADFMSKVVADPTFQFRITYADVYGNCWRLDHGNVIPLDECPE